MLERWGLERFVYNIEPIGDDGFFFTTDLIRNESGVFMQKVHVSRKAYITAWAKYKPVVDTHQPCTYGHNENLIYGY